MYVYGCLIMHLNNNKFSKNSFLGVKKLIFFSKKQSKFLNQFKNIIFFGNM